MNQSRGFAASLLIAGVGCMVLSWPVRAEQDSLPRIGIIYPQAPSFDQPIRQQLTARGLVEGKSVKIDWRSYKGWGTTMEAMVSTLVKSAPDVIVVYGTPATRAVLQQTTTIPVVFIVGDPLATGVLSSLSHPGRNATGASVTSVESSAKLLDLITQVVPDVHRILVLRNPSNPLGVKMVEQIASLAGGLRIQLLLVDATNAVELTAGLVRIDKHQADAILVPTDLVFQAEKRRIISAIRSTGLPAVYQEHAFAEAGGLMSYGPDPEEVAGIVTKLVAKILQGAKPADLPVEQVTRLKLLVNLRTATEMGIIVPQSILTLADAVIK
jgi:putative ABC transport system substrate-binding protein